ncbi:phospholipase D-like domain-containing protein [Kocuria sp. CH-021]|uniref:phospholipase D-like domain-containing protein n=1 Tax=Kocuria sp. CH-021 TaxID=3406735 RepID=UPI003C74655E
MKLRFVAQPFDDEKNLADFVEHVTRGGFTDVQVAVAWAKRSGLGRVRDQIEAFRDSGGKLTMIVGVSEGGATKEGLELALELASEAYVFHDPRRTFHPKVYLAVGDSQQSLLVGSSNLTAGGLAWNYEASLWLDWSGVEPDSTVVEVQAWFERLRSEDSACRPLTSELIEKMVASRDIVINSEFRARRVVRKNEDAPEDTDGTEVGSIDGLFTGLAASQLRQLPKLSPKSQVLSRARDIDVEEMGEAGSSEKGSDELPLKDQRVLRRWYRELGHTQAQQKRTPNTQLKGSMTLTQAESEIDHLTYFHDSFFADLPWSPVPDKEDQLEVEVAFHVWIDGHDLGVHNIRISHAPHRASSQGNVPTWLHWNTLNAYLRATNYVGYYSTLERLQNNEFRLIIAPEPAGRYLL